MSCRIAKSGSSVSLHLLLFTMRLATFMYTAFNIDINFVDGTTTCALYSSRDGIKLRKKLSFRSAETCGELKTFPAIGEYAAFADFAFL